MIREKLSDATLEIVARSGYGATEFKSEDMQYVVLFPNMLKASQFAHAPAIRYQFHTGIECVAGYENVTKCQDPFYRPVWMWLTER